MTIVPPPLTPFQQRLVEIRQTLLDNPATRRMATIEHTDFAPHCGTVFRVEVGEGEPVALQLVEVTALPRPMPMADWRTPFTLRFAGPQDRLLQQGIWPLQHESFEEIAIFLVPVEPGIYSAVFD